MNKLIIVLVLPLYILVGILFVQKFSFSTQKSASPVCSKEEILNLKIKILRYTTNLPDNVSNDKCLSENIKTNWLKYQAYPRPFNPESKEWSSISNAYQKSIDSFLDN